MNGINTVWVPGLDHAGLATQSVVEKDLWAKHSQTKFQLGRERFLGEIDRWKDERSNNIISQLQSFGIATNWDRLTYTLSDVSSQFFSIVTVKPCSYGTQKSCLSIIVQPIST